MGTSHPRDIDLSLQNIPTIKLYAEHDGLASVEEVMENKNKLPGGAKLTYIAAATIHSLVILVIYSLMAQQIFCCKNNNSKHWNNCSNFFAVSKNNFHQSSIRRTNEALAV